MSLPVFCRVVGDLAVGPDAVIVEHVAGEAITAGQTVMDDIAITDINLVGKQVKIGTHRIKGIALNTAASGAVVRVLRRGYTTGIKTDTNIADTSLLAPDGTDAVKPATTSTIELLGYALAADSAAVSGLVYIDCM